jgi:hypothetical protein
MKNWKTTTAGIVGGILVAVTGKPDVHSAIMAVVIAAVGVLAKDLDK